MIDLIFTVVTVELRPTVKLTAPEGLNFGV